MIYNNIINSVVVAGPDEIINYNEEDTHNRRKEKDENCVAVDGETKTDNTQHEKEGPQHAGRRRCVDKTRHNHRQTGSSPLLLSSSCRTMC